MGRYLMRKSRLEKMKGNLYLPMGTDPNLRGKRTQNEADVRERLMRSPKFKKTDGTPNLRKIEWFINKLKAEGEITESNPPNDLWSRVHARNKGEFWRGAQEGGKNLGMGFMGKGLYLAYDKNVAEAFANMTGGTVSKYRLPPSLNMLDHRSEAFGNAMRELGMDPWDKVDSPMFQSILANEFKGMGYDGIISDDPFFGIVVFDPSKAKKIGGTAKKKTARKKASSKRKKNPMPRRNPVKSKAGGLTYPEDTQRKNTESAYKGASREIKRLGLNTGVVIDHGAGLGMNTKYLPKGTISYEPFPVEPYKPDFVSPSKLLKKYRGGRVESGTQRHRAGGPGQGCPQHRCAAEARQWHCLHRYPQ